MIHEIGVSAGMVWQYLNEHGPATPAQISKSLQIKESLTHTAIGWLAREGKLAFEGDEKTMTLSLAHDS